MRFRLLRGIFQSRDPRNIKDERTGLFVSKTYHRGDVVESDHDLELLHGSLKFQNLDRLEGGDVVNELQRKIAALEAENARLRESESGEPLSQEDADSFLPDNIDSMSVEELKKVAESVGADLKGVNKKEEILKRIRATAQELVSTG